VILKTPLFKGCKNNDDICYIWSALRIVEVYDCQIRPVDTSNENVKKAANFATSIYNQQSGNEFAFKVIKIDLASVEVRPSLNYKISNNCFQSCCENCHLQPAIQYWGFQLLFSGAVLTCSPATTPSHVI
uniref:Cystatin domain-containing protein n=1 Tax=Erpetoichthys calabaricus TaxID=27687 RepID=A0A8C4SND7_ERPCA